MTRSRLATIKPTLYTALIAWGAMGGLIGFLVQSWHPLWIALVCGCVVFWYDRWENRG